MMVNGPNHIDIFLSKKYLLIIIIRCKCNYLKYFSNKCDYLNNAYLHDIGSGKRRHRIVPSDSSDKKK